MFEKGAGKERVHSDLNTGSVLLGVVVERRANVRKQTALYKNCLKVLQGGIFLWVKGAWVAVPERYGCESRLLHYDVQPCCM